MEGILTEVFLLFAPYVFTLIYFISTLEVAVVKEKFSRFFPLIKCYRIFENNCEIFCPVFRDSNSFGPIIRGPKKFTNCFYKKSMFFKVVISCLLIYKYSRCLFGIKVLNEAPVHAHELFYIKLAYKYSVTGYNFP